MVYIIGIAITFFLSFILFTKQDKTGADKILFVWLGLIMVHLSLFAIISSQEYLNFPYFLGFEIPLPLLHGPFLLLYTASLTNGKITGNNKLLHFIPYVIGLISTIPFLLLSSENKVSVYQNEGVGYETLTSVIFFGIVLSGISYSFLALRLLVKHKRKIKDNYSNTERINLLWLYRLIFGLSCIWIIVWFADDEYIFSAVVLYILLIGYYGIKQVGIFTNMPSPAFVMAVENPVPIELPSNLNENSKYENSSLPESQLESIHGELMQLMRERKLFLTPELTLTMVSQQLDVHPNTLSQVINRVEQKNFFDFINSLRVGEFTAKAAKPENQKFTLLALAYECGFNSKTSFNRNFKNITGKSPTEYLKEIKITLK